MANLGWVFTTQTTAALIGETDDPATADWNITTDEATCTYPELAQLTTLAGPAWAFRYFGDENGCRIGVVGWRATTETIDALWIFDPAGCRATRLLVGRTDDPDEIAWEYTGDLLSCLEELTQVGGQ
ncbi:MAG TPA: hypothetical protein VGM60_07205 [Pseudonocardia sp.]|uniref:hypothetical protein n=1 Tax=Pseudonocardia sp. TaxID=60912 RepID=UPI002F415DE9